MKIKLPDEVLFALTKDPTVLNDILNGRKDFCFNNPCSVCPLNVKFGDTYICKWLTEKLIEKDFTYISQATNLLELLEKHPELLI